MKKKEIERRADELESALASLLSDVEGGVDFGYDWRHPDNNFHESVMKARRLLGYPEEEWTPLPEED
jgi:hypothetical protein